MDTTVKNTLLALLLALKDLEAPLSKDEQTALAEVAEQLAATTNAWKSLIEPRLLSAIEANTTLNQLYQTTKSDLDTIGGEIPLNILPTQEQLEAALPPSNTPMRRGDESVGDLSEPENTEIVNISINILASPNPSETVKKLSRFEQVKQHIKHRIIR